MKNKSKTILTVVSALLIVLATTVLASKSPEETAEQIIQGTQEHKWHLHDTAEGIRSEIKIHDERVTRLKVELTEAINEWNRQDGIEQGAKQMLEAFTKEQ